MVLWTTKLTLDHLKETKSLTSEDEIDNRDKVADAGGHASHSEPASPRCQALYSCRPAIVRGI